MRCQKVLKSEGPQCIIMSIEEKTYADQVNCTIMECCEVATQEEALAMSRIC